MEQKLLAELRTIKLMCVVNFVELQEIRSKLNIPELTDKDRYAYLNRTALHVDALEKKLLRLIKDDLPNLWGYTIQD